MPTEGQAHHLVMLEWHPADKMTPRCHLPARGGREACMRGRKPKGTPVEDAMRGYLAACRIAGNVGTWLSAQEDILTAFIAYHEPKLRVIEQAMPFHLTAFLAFCQRERANGSSTLHRKGTVIRAWARWCRKSGMASVCAMADADIPPERPEPVEFAALDVYLAKIEELNPRYADEFRVYLGSGLRRGELLHLWWEDIDLETGTVHIRRRKNWSPKARRDRMVGLTKDAKAALVRIIAKRKKDGTRGPYLNEDGFPVLYPTTLTHAWLDFTREAGLPPRLHSTRHAHATAAVDSGAILTDVQTQLGHARIDTTMRYVRPNPEGPLRMIRAMDRNVS